MYFSINNSDNKSPNIQFDMEIGIIKIEGNSIMEDPILFYKPLIEHINIYLLLPKSSTNIYFKLGSINTASLKCLYDVLKMFEVLVVNGYQVELEWKCESNDDYMSSLRDEMRSFIRIPINRITNSEKTFSLS